MSESTEPPKSYLFIVTYGRSGSTLLHSILSRIEGYYLAGENTNTLFWLYRSYQAALATRSQWGKRPTELGNPWFAAERVQPQAYGRRLVRVFLDEVLRPPAEARVVGFKEIRWFNELAPLSEFLDFIAKFMTPSKFVFNTRDPVAVSNSKWWAKRPQDRVVAEIERNHAWIDAYCAQNPDIAIRVHY